jgi:hypothetical protein
MRLGICEVLDVQIMPFAEPNIRRCQVLDVQIMLLSVPNISRCLYLIVAQKQSSF